MVQVRNLAVLGALSKLQTHFKHFRAAVDVQSSKIAYILVSVPTPCLDGTCFCSEFQRPLMRKICTCTCDLSLPDRLGKG